jgi:GNAT superfamily N-acetyltransferase
VTESILIEELPLPDSIDAIRSTDYKAVLDVHNAVVREYLGDTGPVATFDEYFAYLVDHEYERKRLFIIRHDGVPVAYGITYVWVEPDSKTVWLDVCVRADFRRRGYGSALLDHIEGVAREAGKPIAQGGGKHRTDVPGPRIASPTGFGEVAQDDAVATFLTHRGWSLAQVYRYSRLPLPLDDARLQTLLAAAWDKAGSDYRLETWIGPTPDRWLDDVATIMARMPTDAPSGDLEVDEEPWDADRVRNRDERRRRAALTPLVAAVVHVPSGALVAFNDVLVPDDRTRPVGQAVTLVLKEHRGHRLGMIVKLANIRQLQDYSPESPAILTDNAEENRPMLDVNEAIGFVPIAYNGAWQKTLT